MRPCRFLPLLLSAVFLLLAGCGGHAAVRAPVHLFILSGQSNMGALHPEKAFLPELRALLPGAELLHFKIAVSGEPIRYWLPEWNAIAAEAGLSARNDKGPIYYEQILARFKALYAEHPVIDSVTFCWMQGERDAKTGLAAVYQRALTQLIANLRRDLGRSDLHVVIGRLSDHAPGADLQAGWDQVRNVQLQTARSDPRVAWVDTDDLNNLVQDGRPVDDLHYSPEGYVTFAQRLARQSVRLIQGQPPDPSGRPGLPD